MIQNTIQSDQDDRAYHEFIGLSEPVAFIPSWSLASRAIDCNLMEKASTIDPLDYTLAIKCRGHSSNLWRWEISVAGKRKPVRQSDFFDTMSKSAGKPALGEIRANRVTCLAAIGRDAELVLLKRLCVCALKKLVTAERTGVLMIENEWDFDR